MVQHLRGWHGLGVRRREFFPVAAPPQNFTGIAGPDFSRRSGIGVRRPVQVQAAARIEIRKGATHGL